MHEATMMGEEIATAPISKRRILVVDDDRDICECLGEFFKAKGFAVSSAFSGEQALDYLQSSAPQVVVLDILLPGLSGLEVLRRIKAACPGARVMMMTGLPHLEFRRQAQAYGACGYVTKPFDFSDQTWAPVFSQ